MGKHVDPHRTEHPPFQTGDKVLINAKNIRTRRPSKKLNHRYLGPFPITKLIEVKAVQVGLPKTIYCHNIFHVSLVEPYKTNIFDGRKQRIPELTIVDEEEEYEPEKILQAEWKKASRRTKK